MIEAEINRFIVEGQYSLAVILSQTMLELLVEREVRGLAEGLDTGSFGEATLELLGSFNLNRRTQRFFEHSLAEDAGHFLDPFLARVDVNPESGAQIGVGDSDRERHGAREQ